jgi:hypothetical protein
MTSSDLCSSYHLSVPKDSTMLRDALRLDTISFLEHLELYTKRRLSHQSNVLNAFEGLLKLLTFGERPQWQYWGIPVQPCTYSKYQSWILDGSGTSEAYAQEHAAL